MTDTPIGETVVPAKNDGTPAVAPAVATPAVEPPKEDPEVAKLRKELEQKTMRENQLLNQIKANEDAKAAEEAKKLEENNQYKELFEQEKAKREAIETEAEETVRKAELRKAKQEVLAEFSDEVKLLAEDLGLELADTDEATVTAFKEKLEKVNKGAAMTGKVNGNNPKAPSNESELSTDELRVALADENSFHDVVTKRFPGIAAMTNPKS